MSGGRGQRIEALFQDACDMPAEERDAFLRRECGGDAALLAEIKSLLAHVDNASPEFLEGRSSDAPESPPIRAWDHLAAHDDSDIPRRFGRYEIIRRIGQGGMGTVFEAEQDNPRRRVALKILRASLDRSDVLRRFKREAHLLGALQHPAITHVYDAGVIDAPDGGQPFIAMEFVDGVPINAWAREQGRTVHERLKIVAQIADAVQHAHERGIVHRDLKPANILVTKAGQPKILDFGIARVTDNDIQTVTMQTEMGQLMGTVPYMSPEQVLGDSSQIEATSDVYALGVLLFELLADRLPLDVRGRSIPEAVRIIRDEEPSRLATIDSRFRGDIDTIVLKALEKDRKRRYLTASELADDIRRHLRNEPIRARPATTLYQLRKFAQRNKKLVTAVLFAFATLLVATIVTAGFAFSEARMRHLADAEKENAQRAAYRSGLIAAQAAMRTHDIINARRILESTDPARRGGWEWRHLMQRLDASDAVIVGHASGISSVEFAPDGQRLLAACNDGTIRVWDVPTRTHLRTLTGHIGRVKEAVFTPDGSRIVSMGADDTIRVWNRDADQATIVIEADHSKSRPGKPTILEMDISPDSRFVAATLDQQLLCTWDIKTGQLVRSLNLNRKSGRIHSVAYATHDDVPVLLVSWLNGLLRIPLLEATDPPARDSIEFQRGPNDFVPSSIDYAPDAKLIATGCGDKSIVLWNSETLTHEAKLRGHSSAVMSIAIDPTGRYLASGSRDQTLRLWNIENRELIAVCPGHTQPVQSVDFSPDGAWIASASGDDTIRLWSVQGIFDRIDTDVEFPGEIQGRLYREHNKYAYDVAFDPSDPRGHRLASIGWGGRVNIWDANDGTTHQSFDSPIKSLRCLDYSPSGRWIAVGLRGREIELLSTTDGALERAFVLPGVHPTSVAISPDESLIAATNGVDFRRDGRGRAVIWELQTGREVARFDEPNWHLAAHGGNRLFLGAFGKTDGRLIDAATREVVCTFSRPNVRVHGLSFSSDGKRFAVSRDDGAVSIRDTESGRLLGSLMGHTARVFDAAFTPDMTRIATCSNDNTIRIWDSGTFEELLVLRGHGHYVHAIAFSPDGSILASASGDSTVRIWDSIGTAMPR